MSGDDAVWTDYLAWLRQADDLNDPAEVFRAYGRTLGARGIADPKAHLGVVLRLVRARPDAWPLMFRQDLPQCRAAFHAAPNALLSRP